MILSSCSGGGGRTVQPSGRNLTGPSLTPVPLVPYSPHPQIMLPPPGLQGQLVCNGCHTLLLYPHGALSAQYAIGNIVTTVPPQANQFSHVSCGGCGAMLMYQYGEQFVICPVCQLVSSTGQVNPMTRPAPTHGPAYASTQPPASLPQPSRMRRQTRTVLVENPMTLDESGKLVSNLAVGVEY